MSARKALKEKWGEWTDEDVIRRLEHMLDDSKVLCKLDDSLLQGQMQVILGMLADILEAKDPHHSFHHVVEYE